MSYIEATDTSLRHGAYPATLMYRGYRNSTCTSINHVVCHGIPATSRCAKATSSISTSP
jgi:methionine aminopeptidase